MTDKQSVTIFVSKGGEVRHVHSTEAAKITSNLAGERNLRRASHVEPTSELRPAALQWMRNAEAKVLNAGPEFGGDAETYKQNIMQAFPQRWWADLTPVDGPVLGPFVTNNEALAAELKWLDDHGAPVSTKP